MAEPGYHPTQPKPGSSVDTGTIADTSERLPDLRPVTPTAAPIEDPAELGDVFEASRRVTRSDRSDFNEVMIRDGYAQIMPALGLPDSENPGRFYELDPQTSARTGSMAQPSTLATQARQGEALPFGGKYLATRGLQERLIADEIRKRRAIDLKFLPGVPDTVAGLRAYFLAAEKAKRTAAQATLQRSPGGVAGFVTSLAGGAVEAFHDPLNLATLPIGGGGKTILGVAAREALTNGILELGQQPFAAANRAEFGEHLTVTEALTNSATAAAGGAVIGTGLHVGGKAVKGAFAGNLDLASSRAYKLFAAMPERIKAKFGAGIVTKWGKRIAAGDNLADVFGELDNRELASVASAVHEGKLTPDEQSAAHVLERGQDVGESSPFQPGAAGDGAHEAGLAGALKDIEDANAPRSSAPEQGITVESYVDDYIRGGGRDDPNMEQFAANNGPAIEDEFQRRAATAGVGRPSPALSTARRPQAFDAAEPAPAAIERFIGKVRHVESAGNDAADNPLSSADGRFQTTDATFRDYHKRLFGTDPGAHPSKAVKNAPATQEKIMAALTHDNAAALQRAGEAVNDGNLYLYHFLGSGDGAKVLKANPETPIERILPEAVLHANGFLRGKSASETIAWAHAKMGAATAAVPARPGFASTLEAASEDPAIAQLRAEAMQLDQALIGTTRNLAGDQVPIYGRRVKASDVLVDAERFQFKSGGDAQGVTERLNGVEEWDPALAGRVMLWEELGNGNGDGRLFAADGHQRVGLAKRISGEIPLDAVILREADGISADEARTLAALKNVAEGTGSAIDAAKVVRGAGADALKRLPPRSALVRDAGAIARLSDEAFGAVYNGVIPPDFAAAIGRLLPDNPAAHAAMVDLLVKTDPANRGQAESIVRQGMAAGFHVEHQDELFGSREVASSLMLERAKVLERGLAELRKMRLVHKTAAENKGALEAAGSSIAAERSAKEAQANAQAAEIVSRLAFRAGPIADALNDGARSLAAGGKLGSLARDFADRIRGLNLADLDRADANGGGRLGEAGEAGSAISEEPGDPGEPGFFGELEPQPSPAEIEAATERFSDPDGDGVKQQAESLVHDFRAAIDAEKLAHAVPDSFSDAEVAQVFADQALDDAVNARALRHGRELKIDHGEDLGPDAPADADFEALHAELQQLALEHGDLDPLIKHIDKAIDEGRLKLKDLGEPEHADLTPLPPSETFTPPARTVKAAEYAGPRISPEEAKVRIEGWKAEAQRIGRESPPPPGSVILSLFDASGRWSKPYEEMGYTVVRLDMKAGHDLLRNQGHYLNAIDDLKAKGGKIVGVLAQPPCTTFAGSGARWWDPRHNRNWGNAVEKMWGPWATKFFSSPVEYNQFLVASAEEFIAKAAPEFFAMENPVGRIEKLTGLPAPTLRFDPNHFGDPYTKATSLYGKFNPELPTAHVEPVEGSRMHKLRSSAEKDGGLRSLTSEPFAYAFALANRPGTEGGVLHGGAAPPGDLAIAAVRDTLGLELDDEARAALKELDDDDAAIKSIKDCL